MKFSNALNGSPKPHFFFHCGKCLELKISLKLTHKSLTLLSSQPDVSLKYLCTKENKLAIMDKVAYKLIYYFNETCLQKNRRKFFYD